MAHVYAPDSSPLRKRIQSPDANGQRKMTDNGHGASAVKKQASPYEGLEFSKTKFQSDREQSNGRGDHRNAQASSSSNRLESLARSINGRSQDALPSQPGHSDARSAQKSFNASLDQFRYSGPGSMPQRKTTTNLDNDGYSSPLSDLSDLDDESPKKSTQPPKKKRRFHLGKSASEERSSAERDAITISDDESPLVAQKKRVITIPDSPSDSSPLKPTSALNGSPASPLISRPIQRPSHPVTKSLIKPPPPKSGIQVTTKVMPRPQALPASRPIAKAPSSKALERVKSSGSNRSPSTTDADENDFSESDDSSDGGYDVESKNERKALQWFNNNSKEQMMDIVGLTADQAEIIVDLRPFRSTDDLTNKLGDAKGVNPKLFYNCTDLLASLQQIDSVLEKCGKMGSKLNDALNQWKTDSNGDSDYLHSQPEGASEGVQLRDFQLYGVNWLSLLYRHNCSGILADDMGLGKTAQVISFLNHIVLQRKCSPHLVVVPSSVLTNWMREFTVFGPELRVFKYHGPQKERHEQQHELRSDRSAYDVVITTYDMASGSERDHNFLRKYEFDAIIYDEGHILKNQKSVKYGKLMRIRAKWRLLLTGTPLQNNLGELMSLLKFIMPSYFRGAEEALSQLFSVSQETQLSRERIQRAKQMMQPFVLRRKKIDVLDSLKSKTERIKYCDMTDDQRKLYKKSFARSRAALLEQKENEEAEKTRETRSRTKSSKTQTIKSGHVLMELRKAANHPLLFREYYDDRKIDALARDYLKVAEHATDDLQEKKEDFAINSDAELCMSIAMQYPECSKHVLPSKAWLNSGKIAALKEVIDEAKKRGERLIVFSQFVQTLEIVCRALEVMKVTYRGFTGSTDVNARQELVDEFTRDESITCFLLSTRAGGVGINLTAANWVVLFDQDFNPQNDRQAADRCYRMGQEKEVTIVRLISRGTIDEHIFKLGNTKLKLADRVQAEQANGSAKGGDAADSAAGTTIDVNEADEENEEAAEKRLEKSLLAGIMAAEDPDSP